MKTLLSRFIILGALLLFVFALLIARPQPAQAYQIGSPCDKECVQAVIYCKSHPTGFWYGNYVYGSCTEHDLQSGNACDVAFCGF